MQHNVIIKILKLICVKIDWYQFNLNQFRYNLKDRCQRCKVDQLDCLVGSNKKRQCRNGLKHDLMRFSGSSVKGQLYDA